MSDTALSCFSCREVSTAQPIKQTATADVENFRNEFLITFHLHCYVLMIFYLRIQLEVGPNQKMECSGLLVCT